MVLEYLLYLAPLFLYGIFGRWLPPVPIINPWNIRCVVWEVRGNGFFPKWDYGKNRKDKEGNDIFDLKKSNIQTIPKKYTDAIKGMDKYNYLFLLQPSKNTLVALDPQIVMKSGEHIDAFLKGVLQEEKTFTLRKFALERNVQKVLREPSFIAKNATIMVGVFMILAITVFVAVSADPYVTLTDGANRASESAIKVLEQSDKVQQTNLLIAEKLDRIATSLSGG